MKALIYIKKLFTTGVVKDTTKKIPSTFLGYYLSFMLNYIWTLGSLVFMALLIHSGLCNNGNGFVYYLFAGIPTVLLVYNIVTEYCSFKGYLVAYKIVQRITSIVLIALIITAVLILIIL